MEGPLLLLIKQEEGRPNDAKSQSAPPSPSRRRHRASAVPNVKVERRCHGDEAYSWGEVIGAPLMQTQSATR